jgi:glycosyltransferase involved in cell wall biosynthesis
MAMPEAAAQLPTLAWRGSGGKYVVTAKIDDPVVRPARARLIWAANTAQAMYNLGVPSLLVGTAAGLPFKTDTLAGMAAVRRHLGHLYGVRADFDVRIIHPTGTGSEQAARLASLEFPRYVLPDAALVHTRDPLVAVACAKRKIAYVWEHHDEDYQNKFTDYHELATGSASCRAIVAITESIRDSLIGNGVPPQKVLVLSSGVNATTQQARPDRARSWRDFLLQGGYEKVVAYCGGMQLERGIEHILAAAESMPSVRFVFLGGHQNDLVHWQGELARRELANCKLLGYHPHETVCEVQQASDALVFSREATGRPEVTSPLKFFEYLLTGVPIVAAKVAALDPYRNGLDVAWYDPAEPSGLVPALRTTLWAADWPRSCEANVAFGRQHTWEQRQRRLLNFVGPVDPKTSF